MQNNNNNNDLLGNNIDISGIANENDNISDVQARNNVREQADAYDATQKAEAEAKKAAEAKAKTKAKVEANGDIKISPDQFEQLLSRVISAVKSDNNGKPEVDANKQNVLNQHAHQVLGKSLNLAKGLQEDSKIELFSYDENIAAHFGSKTWLSINGVTYFFCMGFKTRVLKKHLKFLRQHFRLEKSQFAINKAAHGRRENGSQGVIDKNKVYRNQEELSKAIRERELG